MKMLLPLLLVLTFTTYAKNPITQIDCRHQYLPKVTVGSNEIYQFAHYSCSEQDLRSQIEIENYPSHSFKKFKQLGEKRTGTIYRDGVAVEQEYSESEMIYTSATYYIPTCDDHQNRWRLQVAAISDPIQSANEVFYNKISEIVEGCQIPTREIQGWNFCKTYGEEFGSYEHSGTNKTTRLYLQLNNHRMNLFVGNPNDAMASSCRENVEGDLFARLQRCQLEQPSALIVPPVAFINKFFEVSNHKLQFTSCDNLASSSHLKLKP